MCAGSPEIELYKIKLLKQEKQRLNRNNDIKVDICIGKEVEKIIKKDITTIGGYIMKNLRRWERRLEMIKELTEKPYKNLSLSTKDEWEEKIIVSIDEFIKILKNFHYIDCEFKECKECELYGEVCDVLSEFSNKYM